MPESTPLTDASVCPFCKDVLRHAAPMVTPGALKRGLFICPTHGRFLRAATGLRPVQPFIPPTPPNRSSVPHSLPEMGARRSLSLSASATASSSTLLTWRFVSSRRACRRPYSQARLGNAWQAGIAVMSPSTKTTFRVIVTVTPGSPDAHQSSISTRVILSGWFVQTCGGGRRFEQVMWSSQRLQVVSDADVDTCVRQDVESLLDQFVAKYASVRRQS